jgi:hypothetical protein
LPVGVEVRPRDLVEVIVHADQPRHHGVAAQVEHGGVAGSGGVGACADRHDLAAIELDVAIVERGMAEPVDDADVREDDAGVATLT